MTTTSVRDDIQANIGTNRWKWHLERTAEKSLSCRDGICHGRARILLLSSSSFPRLWAITVIIMAREMKLSFLCGFVAIVVMVSMVVVVVVLACPLNQWTITTTTICFCVPISAKGVVVTNQNIRVYCTCPERSFRPMNCLLASQLTR